MTLYPAISSLGRYVYTVVTVDQQTEDHMQQSEGPESEYEEEEEVEEDEINELQSEDDETKVNSY